MASALITAESKTALANGGEKNIGPWDLLWVLVVERKDGIAERRGVGQVLASALETAIKPGPEVKSVLCDERVDPSGVG